MLFEKIFLENEDDDVYLETYAADKINGFIRKAILVIPGGGYENICSEREGEPIAMAFLPYGYNAFVLHYSVGRKKKFPAQLIQASKAMKLIRDHADEYGIDPSKIYVTGFSAGGHLAASLGTMWHKEEIYKAVNMPYGYNKPAGVMLIYPVITSIEHFAHEYTICNLLCTDMPTREEKVSCSIELNIDNRAVPAYIVHTINDEVVNVRNSLILADTYLSKGIPFEMHIYPDSPHGFALGNQITRCGVAKYDNPSLAEWVEHAVCWAEKV